MARALIFGPVVAGADRVDAGATARSRWAPRTSTARPAGHLRAQLQHPGSRPDQQQDLHVDAATATDADNLVVATPNAGTTPSTSPRELVNETIYSPPPWEALRRRRRRDGGRGGGGGGGSGGTAWASQIAFAMVPNRPRLPTANTDTFTDVATLASTLAMGSRHRADVPHLKRQHHRGILDLGGVNDLLGELPALPRRSNGTRSPRWASRTPPPASRVTDDLNGVTVDGQRRHGTPGRMDLQQPKPAHLRWEHHERRSENGDHGLCLNCLTARGCPPV